SARAVAIIGAPTPVNTVWPSRSSRAPMTASSSLTDAADALTRSPRSSAQLPRALARRSQRARVVERQVLGERGRRIHVALEVAGDAVGAVLLDGLHIVIELPGLGLVEAVALVRISAAGNVDERVYREARDDRAIRMTADLLLGDDLLRRDEHG